MGSRWGPPDGWDELPECATNCFRDGLREAECEKDDRDCWCEDANWDVVGKALDGCDDCSSRDLWHLGASYQVLCEDSESMTADPTSSMTMFIAHDQPTSSPTADAESTTLTFIPIASHTPDPEDLETKSLDSSNSIPTPTIIGMAVGFVLAAFLIIGLIFVWLRERKRRRNLEWSTEPKRESKLSLGSKRASKHASTKGDSSTQVKTSRIWRPSGTTGTPSP